MMAAARKAVKVVKDWPAAIQATAITVGILATVCLQVWTQLEARAAAVKVEEVKQALAASDKRTGESMEEIQATGEAVHILVNSSMSAQLRISALALRRLAVMTKDPEDVAAAELAEKLLREHDQKQNTLDSKD